MVPRDHVFRYILFPENVLQEGLTMKKLLSALVDFSPDKVRRKKDQKKWNPCPQNTVEHGETFLNYHCHKKEIHEQYKSQTDKRHLHRRYVVEFFKIEPRYDAKDDRSSQCMNNQCVLFAGNLKSDANNGSTKHPANECVNENNDYLFHVISIFLFLRNAWRPSTPWISETTSVTMRMARETSSVNS